MGTSYAVFQHSIPRVAPRFARRQQMTGRCNQRATTSPEQPVDLLERHRWRTWLTGVGLLKLLTGDAIWWQARRAARRGAIALCCYCGKTLRARRRSASRGCRIPPRSAERAGHVRRLNFSLSAWRCLVLRGLGRLNIVATHLRFTEQTTARWL